MNPSYHQIVFFALYERFIAYPPITVIFTVFAARGFMQIGLELDPWGARSGAAGTLRGHSPPQACRQARSAPPASSAAFPQQRRVRLQSTIKKELSSIKKRPLRAFCFAHVVSRSTILKMHCFSRPDLPLLFLLQTGAKQRQQKRLLIQREPARCRFLPKAPPTVFRSV